MNRRRMLRRAGLVAVAVAVGSGSLWMGLPGPWGALLAIAHAPILLFRRRWVPALLAVDLCVVAWSAYLSSRDFFGGSFDTWMHVTMVRRILEHGPIPPDPYYVGYSAAPILSLIHHVYAAATWLTGQSIGDVWLTGIPVVTLLIGLISFFFHRELLRDSRAALLATLFFVAWRHFEWPYANYPRVVAPAFAMLALGLLLRSLRKQHRRSAAGAGIVLGLAIATHPISGAIGATVAAAFLLSEFTVASMAGRGRALAAFALAFIAGSVVAAGPWIVYDAIALFRADELAPIIADPKQDLRYHLSVHGLRIFGARMKGDDFNLRWLVLWGPPIVLGIARCIFAATPRGFRSYLIATLGVCAIVLGTPLREILSDLISPRYVARTIGILPVSALAGFGLAWIIRHARELPSQVVAGLILAVYVALPLETIATEGAPPPIPLSAPVRPELAMLGDLFDQRVVLTLLNDAYVLPYFTGAFVVWNHMGHSNPYAWNAERVGGARRILAGRSSPEEIRRYAGDFSVDFALLPTGADRIIGPLLASGAFRQRRTVPGYVVLERTAPLIGPLRARRPAEARDPTPP